MADNKAQLAPGFEEVPLAEGFEEVPLTSEPPSALSSALTSGVQDISDIGRGTVQGLTAGLSDEAIAALKASLPSEEEKSQDWKTLYRKYQEIEQKKNEEAKARSPWLYGTGQALGFLAPAVLTAGASVPEQLAAKGAAETAAKLTAGQIAKKVAIGTGISAIQGGIMGGAESETGKLIGATPEEQAQLLQDIKTGVKTAGIIGLPLHAAAPLASQVGGALKEKLGSKIENYISDSPFWTQVMKAKELGEQGKNIYSEKAIQGPIGETSGLIHQDTNATRDLVDRIYNVDSKLGQKVGQAIDNATDQGVTVDLSDPMMNSVNTFKSLIDKDQTLRANPKAQKLYDTIFSMAGEDGQFDAANLTPKEVQSLRTDVMDFADSIKQKDPNIASLGYQFQAQAGDLLKQAVPEYATAAERFEQFRRLVPETLISGATPVDISGVKLGNLKNDEAKLFNAAKNMIQGSRMPGAGSSASKETFKNLINGVDAFEKGETERLASGEIKASEELPKLTDADKFQAEGLKSLIQDKADQSALLQQAWRVNPQESVGTATKGALFGRGSVMNLANKYGLYKDTLTKAIPSPVQLTQKIYNASQEELRGMAQKMTEIPGLKPIGQTLLNGLDNKDAAGVNAAIFSIMQNPQARIMLNGENLESQKENK